MKSKLFLCLVWVMLSSTVCARIDVPGEGVFTYADYAPYSDKPIDVRDVVEVDDGAEFVRVGVFLERRVVRREHDVVSGETEGLRHHKLRFGRAVGAAVILRQQPHDTGVRRRLDGKILTEARVPGKRLFHVFHIAADAGFIVKVKRCRIGLDDLFDLFLRHECFLFHVHNPFDSSKPSIRFMFWTAAPEAPLPRLSSRAVTVTRSSLPVTFSRILLVPAILFA